MKFILIIFSILSMIASSSLNAFDDKKEGFYFSLGAGLHTLKMVKSVGSLKETTNENGIATSFNIGYGLTNDFILYYSNNVNWYNNYDSGETYLNRISGIGVTYYAADEIYLKCVYGLAADYAYGDRSFSINGDGYEIGVGYDIAKHVSIELDYTYSDYDELRADGTLYKFGDGVSITAQSIRMLIRYNWY